MDIYLIRHTTPDIANGICYGQSDLNLVDNYPKEFEKIVTELPDIKSSQVISSPLKRCTLLANHFSKNIRLDDRLKELDFGDWELKAWNDIPDVDINPWMKDFVNVATPNGESYVELAARVNAFFEELLISEADKNMLIVTHAGPMRAILSKLLEVPLKKSFNIKIDYGDIFRLKKEKGVLRLVSEVEVSL